MPTVKTNKQTKKKLKVITKQGLRSNPIYFKAKASIAQKEEPVSKKIAFQDYKTIKFITNIKENINYKTTNLVVTIRASKV